MTVAIGQACRRRLPNRRPAVTHDIDVEGGRYVATIGFDELARPRELFLSGGKAGSQIDALLGDVATAISVALQSGVSAEALARSISRVSQGDGLPTLPGSVIGAALDLLVRWEPDQ